jgi:hypothetical protein
MAGMPATGGVAATGGVMKYMTPLPDAATGTGGVPGTGGMTAVPLYHAAAPDSGQTGTGGIMVRYAAPMTDAGSSSKDAKSMPDIGSAQPAYMAVLPPDQRRDGGGGGVALYAAPVPIPN